MTADDLREDAAEIGRDREVAPVVALFARQPRPAAVDLAAADILSANDHHRVAVPVVRAAVAVLGDGASELAHREDDDVAHAIAEVSGQRGDAAAEVVEPGGELARGRALVDVGVPSASFRERDLESDVRLHELCDLAERLAVSRARV